MKNVIAIICTTLAVLLATSSSASNTMFGKSLKGSGKIVSKSITMPANISEISASRAVNVIISDQNSDKIEIKADDNVMEYVVVAADGDELRIGISKKINNVNNISVTVTLPNNGKYSTLEASSAATISAKPIISAREVELDASSAAKIIAVIDAAECEVSASSAAKIKVAMKVNRCEIDATSAAKIDADIRAGFCEASASSAGKVTIKGTTDKLDAEASSSGKVSAFELVAAKATATASSGSNITLQCTDFLSANASSGADISYTGDCRSNIEKSSGGSVSHK